MTDEVKEENKEQVEQESRQDFSRDEKEIKAEPVKNRAYPS